MKTSIANQITVHAIINAVSAFELCYDLAVSISEHHNFSTMRFDDNSEVAVTITDDHDIFIIER